MGTAARRASTPADTLTQPPAGTSEGITQAGERRSARIESLRALAALAVLWGHVMATALVYAPDVPVVASELSPIEKLVKGGGFGVYFFFGLTGYLLFWPFVKRDFAAGGPVDLRRYALNRALRILPLYYAVVIIVLLFQGRPLSVWARFLTFTENFFDFTVLTVVGPAWSLVVELHFYILLPVLAWGLARLASGSRSRATLVLCALGLAALAVRVITVYEPDLPSRTWAANLPATFLFFIPGMLLALLRVAWEERRPDWLRGALERSDVWILASLPIWVAVIMYEEWDALLCLAVFLMIGACVLPLRAGPLTNALSWRPLAVVGVASYSLYLWHVPVVQVVRDAGVSTEFAPLALIAVPVTILVALVSYRLIEAPFLRLRKQWSRSAAKQIGER